MNKNQKKNNNSNDGLRFTPRHLTSQEVEFCKGLFLERGGSLSHKTQEISVQKHLELYTPSPKSTEIWSIIYDTTPSQLSPSCPFYGTKKSTEQILNDLHKVKTEQILNVLHKVKREWMLDLEDLISFVKEWVSKKTKDEYEREYMFFDWNHIVIHYLYSSVKGRIYEEDGQLKYDLYDLYDESILVLHYLDGKVV